MPHAAVLSSANLQLFSSRACYNSRVSLMGSMKLPGRHMLSPQSLLLVAACLSCDAFKLHGAFFDGKFSVSDRQGAANVAQLAYQQQMISTNTWKALSNVSCFLEAARSAGLTWTESDAENHIVFTANVLKSKLDANSNVSLVSLGGPGRGAFPGLSSILDEDDKGDLQGEAFTATAGLVVSWVQTGKPPSFQDIAQIGIGLATTVLGMMNPLLGAVAGMAFSLIGGLLFPEDPNESPMAQMYKKIMEEVGIAIEQSQVVEAIGDAKIELQAVMDELQWMPAMLGGVKTEAHEPSDDQARILLTYNIMIQHDLAKMSYKIQNSKFGQAETQPATNEWSAAMFPLAEQLILLQTNLLVDIASHDFVDNVDAASARILDLLGDWKTWFLVNIHKAHHANADQAKKTLNWRVTDRSRNFHDEHVWGRFKKDACEINGVNACKAMNCIEKDYDCGKYGNKHRGEYKGDLGDDDQRWCNGGCYEWTAVDFYWQYLAPKVEKIRQDVDKMIAELELGGFERMAGGYCSSTRHGLSWGKDLKDCADRCRSDKHCRFFTYRPSNKACSRYGSATCDLINPQYDHETYRFAARAVQKVASKKRCSGGPGAFESADWAAATGSKVRNSDFDSAGFKKWAEVAWEKCQNEVITTKHVTVFDTAKFRCHTEKTCHLMDAGNGAVWTGPPPPTFTVQKIASKKRCSGGHGAFESADWAANTGSKVRNSDFDSLGFKKWAEVAWAKCLQEVISTKHVTVFDTARFRCHTEKTCHLMDAGNGAVWTGPPPTFTVQKVASKKRCSGGAGAFESADWAANTGSQARNSDFDSAGFKKWAEVAWEKCLEEVISTKHVTVFDNAKFRCHTEKTCHLVDAGTGAVWTGKPPTLTMKEKGGGWCKDRGNHKNFEDHLGTTLNDRARGRQGFDTDQYMAWVRQAWTRCYAKNSRTKWVSVNTDGAYTCFVTDACNLQTQPDMKTWALAN